MLGISDEGINFVDGPCQQQIETQLAGYERGKVRDDIWAYAVGQPYLKPKA